MLNPHVKTSFRGQSRAGTILGAAAVLALVEAAQVRAVAAGGEPQSRIFMATASGGGGGMLVAMEREAPWTVTPIAELNSQIAVVQSAFGRIFVVEPESDLVRVFNGEGDELLAFSVGDGAQPRDIFCAALDLAYVTRAHATHLYRVNPQTGMGEDAVDLSVLADKDGVPDMERMASDGERLYVQLRRVDSQKPWVAGPAAIAVIDLATEMLIDADPSTQAIDAIELDGPSARLRMRIASDSSHLLVSATAENHLDFSGGIEYINLETLTSEGFIVAEADIAAIGGFAMIDDERGYYLFHTDIVASNHLKAFTIAGGSDPELEIVFDAGTYLDALLIDPVTALLYMPASAGGAYVVDTTTDEQVTKGPIGVPAAGPTVDMVIGPVGHSPDLNGDGSVGVPDLLLLLASWGECSATLFALCPADLNDDGGIGVADLLLLLSNWG